MKKINIVLFIIVPGLVVLTICVYASYIIGHDVGCNKVLIYVNNQRTALQEAEMQLGNKKIVKLNLIPGKYVLEEWSSKTDVSKRDIEIVSDGNTYKFQFINGKDYYNLNMTNNRICWGYDMGYSGYDFYIGDCINSDIAGNKYENDYHALGVVKWIIRGAVKK